MLRRLYLSASHWRVISVLNGGVKCSDEWKYSQLYINTNLNAGVVEKQKWALLQTRGLFVLHTDDIKVKAGQPSVDACRRFSHSTEEEFGWDGIPAPHPGDFSWFLKNSVFS